VHNEAEQCPMHNAQRSCDEWRYLQAAATVEPERPAGPANCV
jgi:hypothetical protein